MTWDKIIAEMNERIESNPFAREQVRNSAELLGAVMQAVKSKGRYTEALEAFLLSDKPIRPNDRALLASYISGDLKKGRGRPSAAFGRSQKDRETQLYHLAAHFVENDKEDLREAGVKYRIAEPAIDNVVEFFEETGLGTLDRDRLANHVNRSKQARKK